MLLKSSSSPILQSCLPNSASGSLPDSMPQLARTQSVFLTTSFEGRSSKITAPKIALDSSPVKASKNLRLPAEEGGGGGRGGGGGGKCVGGRGSDGRENTEAYYEMMIEANPGNPLFLANYAQILKEGNGDMRKAEEYYERAILADPSDAKVLSLYADLIWQTHKDSDRAEAYFHQAIQIDPNDCYLLASYARFCWDAEDDEDEEDKAIKSQCAVEINKSPSHFFHLESLAATY